MVIINYLKYLTPQTEFDIKIEFDDINLNIISNITGNKHTFIYGFNGYYSHDTKNIDFFFDNFFCYNVKRIYLLNQQRNWHCVLDNEPRQLKIANKVLNHWKKWFLGRMKERNDPIKCELMAYCYHPSRVNFEILI
jgi:hypothetical protein